jgi:hypothetical protein
MNDFVVVILNLHDEVTALLRPTHDEQARADACQIALHDLIDLSSADRRLHTSFCRRQNRQPRHERAKCTVESLPDEGCRATIGRSHLILLMI